MSAEWYYTRNRERHGPVSAQELKQLAETGALLPTDQVWKEGLGDWVAASRIKGLGFQQQQSSTPPPLPPEAENATHVVASPEVVSKATGQVAYTAYEDVPWYRRSGIITSMFILGFVICGPLVWGACILCFTGDIYTNQQDEQGNLKVWGSSGRIAAIVILGIQLVLMVLVYTYGIL